MALIGSLFSFVLASSKRSSKCSECLKKIPAHSYALTAFRGSRVVKRVCSDGCRETFDDRYWQERADDREWGKKAQR